MHRQLEMVFEEWRQIRGYEDLYEVSSCGRVRRIGKGRGARVGLCIATPLNTVGYPKVNLFKGGISDTQMVHTLVAEAFLGPRPDGLVVNHKDGNKANNHPSNLEYVTYAQNTNHAMNVLGVRANLPKGEQNKNSKLTEKQVREIRTAYDTGETNYSRLGRRFGITGDHVKNLVTRKFWKHLADVA